MRPRQIRQGDVQLQPVPALPAGCAEVQAQAGRLVLALGEVTGHAHAVYDHAPAKARLWHSRAGERYLEVMQPVTLRHEEHAAHTLPPGIYWLPRQVEYTPRWTARPTFD
jgi:hypothetical protein